MKTLDALVEWDAHVKAAAAAHIFSTVETLADEPDTKKLEQGIEELFYQLTGTSCSGLPNRPMLWAIVHTVYHKRLLNHLQELAQPKKEDA